MLNFLVREKTSSKSINFIYINSFIFLLTSTFNNDSVAKSEHAGSASKQRL